MEKAHPDADPRELVEHEHLVNILTCQPVRAVNGAHLDSP
jgi:hypothetical protein